jgi:Flp pilus assembly pilin Flp
MIREGFMDFARAFWRDEMAQDLIEYSLLIMFIAMASIALLGSGKPAIEGIWNLNTRHLVSADAEIPR